MAGDETPGMTRKDERNQRLEAQLRDNLRKRKELARARKVAALGVGKPSSGTPGPRGEEG